MGQYLSDYTKGNAGSVSKPNTYTIDAPTDDAPTVSLKTEGYPSPLTPGSSGNSSKFDSGLKPSISEDFISLNQNGKKINKGSSSEAGQNGHVLLSNVQDATSPVQTYQQFSFTPNYRKVDVKFIDGDITSPPSTFDPTLLDYSNLKLVNPDVESVLASDLSHKLQDVFKKPATLTAKNSYLSLIHI